MGLNGLDKQLPINFIIIAQRSRGGGAGRPEGGTADGAHVSLAKGNHYAISPSAIFRNTTMFIMPDGLML